MTFATGRWGEQEKLRVQKRKQYFSDYNVCRDQKKLSARKAVELALKRGEMTKHPCEKCGSIEVEAHHPDYNKPLEVIWLCIEHHRIVHKKFVNCSVTGCDRPHEAKGFCKRHYLRLWREFSSPKPAPQPAVTPA